MKIIKIIEIPKLDQVFNLHIENNHNYFANNILVSNCHFATTKSVKEVFKKCSNATMRFGVSGTSKALDDSANTFTMLSLLGPMINKISPAFLFKNGYATPITIRMIYMNYLDIETRVKLSKMYTRRKENDGSKLLALEKQVIVENEARLNFIVDIIASIRKNSLVLFHNVKDGYGKKIFDALQVILPKEVTIHYIDGSTDKNTREEYRKDMEDISKQTIMVASFGTFSTGIDISNLEFIYLAESFKSEVIIKQSFGRGMRLMDGKITTKIIDFVDDFSIKGYENYVLKHSREREEIYKNEGFPYKKTYVTI